MYIQNVYEMLQRSELPVNPGHWTTWYIMCIQNVYEMLQRSELPVNRNTEWHDMLCTGCATNSSWRERRRCVRGGARPGIVRQTVVLRRRNVCWSCIVRRPCIVRSCIEYRALYIRRDTRVQRHPLCSILGTAAPRMGRESSTPIRADHQGMTRAPVVVASRTYMYVWVCALRRRTLAYNKMN